MGWSKRSPIGFSVSILPDQTSQDLLNQGGPCHHNECLAKSEAGISLERISKDFPSPDNETIGFLQSNFKSP
ncbi:hypothetical protein NPIL_218261 [Nephila pilipes]|uniref:Uncharacterized protein n=1 Tax=Nephila pilipes TaxID=299642 RepID=A0A8X6TZU9_NEPPI|nr:hypothetical protein NPIL_408821 [Nephila pilipes]GFT60742.1 hypothetical protein NPIL_218261 [Nephila pilipes]